MPLDFLHSVGAHALPLLTAGAAAVTEVGSSILGKVWELWTKKAREEERRRELETLAGMTSQQVKEAVREVAAQLAADRPAPVRAKLEGYLTAVPAQIRRTLRRPSDSAGLTVPPDLRLSKAEDLAPLLPPRPPRFNPGEKAPGTDFELVELLGIGGFGEVWKARNTFMPGAPAVALKFCLDPDAAASLRRETALLDRIQLEGKHPGIVELRNTFLSADPPYLEYELVEGGDLGGLIHDWHREKGGPTPEQAARLVRRLADIVAFAHARGIVHRDLKPANILLAGDRRQGTGDSKTESGGASPSPVRLKVADFGIGGIAAEAAARQARLTLGGPLTAAAAQGSYSLYYASPEQMRGAAADPRDDVHALGVIWYQALVGDLTAEAPRGAGWKKRLAAKGMSGPLIELLESCVASDRDDRPKDAGEVAERIAFLVAEPAPGIDLLLTPETHPQPPPVPAPPVPIAAKPTAPPAPPPGRPADPGGPHGLVAESLRRSRWADFANRLRDIRTRHYRLRWSAGVVCWLVPLGALALAALLVGVETHSVLASEASSRNASLAREIAARHSSSNMPIEWSSIGSGGYFRLGASSLDVKTPDGIYTVSMSSPYSDTGGRLVAFSPVRLAGIIPVGARVGADQYVKDANAKLTEAVNELEPQAVGKNDLRYGWIAGTSAAVVLLGGFLFLRRRAWRKLETRQRNAIAATETEFAPELREFPGVIDLNKPNSVDRLVTALEESGSVPRPSLPTGFPTPALLFHRLCAPF